MSIVIKWYPNKIVDVIRSALLCKACTCTLKCSTGMKCDGKKKTTNFSFFFWIKHCGLIEVWVCVFQKIIFIAITRCFWWQFTVVWCCSKQNALIFYWCFLYVLQFSIWPTYQEGLYLIFGKFARGGQKNDTQHYKLVACRFVASRLTCVIWRACFPWFCSFHGRWYSVWSGKSQTSIPRPFLLLGSRHLRMLPLPLGACRVVYPWGCTCCSRGARTDASGWNCNPYPRICYHPYCRVVSGDAWRCWVPWSEGSRACLRRQGATGSTCTSSRSPTKDHDRYQGDHFGWRSGQPWIYPLCGVQKDPKAHCLQPDHSFS